jgi:hypothetical protein
LTSDVLPTNGGFGVEWVACYESAIEGDARTVLALLEGRGIPCRLEPMGSSVFPSMGFAVLVPADRLEAARELIGSEPEGPTAAEARPDVVTREPAATTLSVGTLVRRALGVVRSHPTVLLTAVAGIVSSAVFDSLFDSLPGDASPIDMLREHFGTLALLFALDTVVHGLAVAFVDGALDGRPSWSEAARRTMVQLSRLLVCGILVGGPFLFQVAFGSWPPAKDGPSVPPAVVAAVLPYVYVMFRLALVPIALIVDRAEIPTAFRRSWEIVGRGWTLILGLIALGIVVSVPLTPLAGISRTIGAVVSTIETVAWVILYRALSRRPTASSSTR